jgi:alpha-beta hydrolase superfamily lysophospholipase
MTEEKTVTADGTTPDPDAGDLHGVVSADGTVLELVVREPAGEARALVVLVHGITVDLDEGGMYVRLADKLATVGIASVRFSFRGHGRSGGLSQDMTITGEIDDLRAIVHAMVARYPLLPLFVVAGSFGAVPTVLALDYLYERGLKGLVLWNPVLDLRRTFLEPELPWGIQNFNAGAIERLRQTGHLDVDGEFRLGIPLFDEFASLDPQAGFAASTMPALVVHGDRDSYVSYDIARSACAERPRCDFHTVAGSDHGFDSSEREDEAISATVDWLVAQSADSDND